MPHATTRSTQGGATLADRTPSGRELEILKVLWELGTASVRDVYERMCPGGGAPRVPSRP